MVDEHPSHAHTRPLQELAQAPPPSMLLTRRGGYHASTLPPDRCEDAPHLIGRMVGEGETPPAEPELLLLNLTHHE